MLRPEAMTTGAIDAELIRVEAGSCSGPRRSDDGTAVLVVVDGNGQALAGEVWVDVEAGDRVVVGPGEPCALRGTTGPIAALLVHPARRTVQAA